MFILLLTQIALLAALSDEVLSSSLLGASAQSIGIRFTNCSVSTVEKEKRQVCHLPVFGQRADVTFSVDWQSRVSAWSVTFPRPVSRSVAVDLFNKVCAQLRRSFQFQGEQNDDQALRRIFLLPTKAWASAELVEQSENNNYVAVGITAIGFAASTPSPRGLVLQAPDLAGAEGLDLTRTVPNLTP